MVNHNKTLEGLHMTDQNDQSENNPSISGRVERIIPTSGEDVVQPLSADRIAAYLKAKELMFNRDDDGDVFINFDGNGFVLLATGALGFYDDWRKVVYKDPNGVSAKFKMVWQSSVAIIAGLALFYLATNSANNILIVPFFKQVALPLGVVGFLVLSYLTIVGTSNAVNLTDGLDGLAAFPVVLVAAGLAIFAYASGHSQFAQYLQLPYVAGANEVVIFCTAMCGACLGFLWFNAYPAQVFMGDVGALALGAALGTVAVIIRQEFVLVIMGGLFVVEAISVMLQVGWYKRTKKRIFLMAPIHHHYEQKGWKETQVVVRFWIITIVLVLIGLSTLKIR